MLCVAPQLSTVAEYEPDDYWAPAEDVVATIELGGSVTEVVASPDGEHVYVAQPDSVAVIGSGNHVVARIPVSGQPRDLVIDAEGTRLFAIDYDGVVSIVNTEDHTVHTVPGHWTSAVAVSAVGVYLCAADASPDGSESCISLIDADGTEVATVPVANEVTALAISPDGARLYVVSSEHLPYHQYLAGWLTIIDTSSHAATAAFAVGASPDGLTVSPDGARLYVTHHDTHSVSAVDLTTETVTPIALGDAPVDVKFTPDGARAYVTNRMSAIVIETGTNAVQDIAAGDLPRGLQISPDGKRAYITNFGDRTVSVVDTITHSVTTAVAVGGHPEAITVSSDGERVYVGDYWSGTVTVISAPTVQDESASRSSEKVSAGGQLIAAEALALTLA